MKRTFGRLIFFRRKIEEQEAIHAGFVGFAMKSLESELEDWVQVSVENNRHLGLSANLSNAIQKPRDRCTGLKRALGGELIDQSVSQRIQERHAELEKVD